jgi:hypothetical protein
MCVKKFITLKSTNNTPAMRQQIAANVSTLRFHFMRPTGNISAPRAVKPHSKLKKNRVDRRLGEVTADRLLWRRVPELVVQNRSGERSHQQPLTIFDLRSVLLGRVIGRHSRINPSGRRASMILYNTIVGLAAGVALVLVAALFEKLVRHERVQPQGFALVFGMTGFILTVLGITISVMWPYKKVLHANIMMGEPALAFGVLLAAASFFLWTKHELFHRLGEGDEGSEQALARIVAVLHPVSVWIFATGLITCQMPAYQA